MSLTHHLKSPESPVRQFIYASAPDLALAGTRGAEGKAIASAFGFHELTVLAAQIPIPDEVTPARRNGHASVAGMAIDYRIRMELPSFSFSDTVAQKGLQRLEREVTLLHRGRHIHELLQQALGFAYLTYKGPDSHPLSLARASVPLAWCEAVYRTGPEIALSGALGKQIKGAKDATELMMSIDDALLFDIVRMHKPLEPLLKQWNQEAMVRDKLRAEPELPRQPGSRGRRRRLGYWRHAC